MAKLNLHGKASKIAIGVAIVIALFMLTIYLFIVIELKQQAIKQSEKTAELLSKDIKNFIEIYFRDALIINQTFSNNFILYKKHKINRLTAYDYLKGSLEQNRKFLAFWTMWEPNAYDNNDKHFAGDSLHDEIGSFAVAYYYDNNVMKYEVNDTSDFSETFYAVPARSKRPLIVDPFHYQYHGNPKIFFETSLVTPIIEKGEFLGVFGMDIDLYQLQHDLMTIKVFNTGFVSILSNSGLIVTHPDSSFIDKNIKNYLFAENKHILNEINKGNYFVTDSKSEFSNKQVMRLFYPINMEYMASPWYIMVEIPENEIYTTATKIQRISLTILITLLILLFYMVYTIIDRRRAENKLRENQLFIQNITEQTPNIIYIFDLLSNKNIYINRNLRELLGYKIGDLTEDINELLDSIMHPDDKIQFADFDKIAEKWEFDFIKEFEYRLKDAHGQWRWFLGKEKVFQINEGKAQSLLGVVTEITERKIAEQKLKENEEKYRLLFENANDAIFILKENRIVECNVKTLEMFGASREEVLQKKPQELSPKAQSDGELSEIKAERYNRQTEDGSSLFFEWKHKKFNGELFDADVSLNKIVLLDENYLLAMVRDISLRKQTELELETYRTHLEELVNIRTNEINTLNEELQQSNEVLYNTVEELNAQKEEINNTLNQLHETQHQLIQSEKMAALGVLTAGIAHEINNPMNFISTSVHILNDSHRSIFEFIDSLIALYSSHLPNNADKIESLKQKLNIDSITANNPRVMKNLQTGVDRVVETIKGLRLYSRMDEADKKPVDIHENIETALLLLNNKIKNVADVEKNFASLPMVNCFHGKITQALLNILDNAVDSLAELGLEGKKGKISITTHAANKKVIITIKDSGKGIPNDILNRIFDPFFTTKSVGKGMGLGLAITQSIIQEHNGTITVTNKENGGAEFVIQLPVL